MSLRFKQHSVLPGFGLGLGYSLFWLCLIVLLPLAALVLKSALLGLDTFWATVTTERVLASLRLSFGASLLAAAINAVFGLLVAWVLVRYPFPGKRLIDALVDLPFALPTAVAGIALTTLYAPNGWFGQLLTPLGLKVAFTPLGVVVALTFIGLPFVVRTVQPVLQELETELEEAALLDVGRLGDGLHPLLVHGAVARQLAALLEIAAEQLVGDAGGLGETGIKQLFHFVVGLQVADKAADGEAEADQGQDAGEQETADGTDTAHGAEAPLAPWTSSCGTM